MTIRQAKYKHNRLVLGMNKYNAARAAGYSHWTANSPKQGIEAYGNLRMPDAMEQVGLTNKVLATYLMKGLNAQKAVSAIYTGKDADERTEDFIDVPDWPSRARFLQIAGKWKGLEQTTVNHSGTVHHVMNDIELEHDETIIDAQAVDPKLEYDIGSKIEESSSDTKHT